jgi:hypothetical protein
MGNMTKQVTKPQKVLFSDRATKKRKKKHPSKKITKAPLKLPDQPKLIARGGRW